MLCCKKGGVMSLGTQAMTLFGVPPEGNSLFSEMDRMDDWTVLVHPVIPIHRQALGKPLPFSSKRGNASPSWWSD